MPGLVHKPYLPPPAGGRPVRTLQRLQRSVRSVSVNASLKVFTPEQRPVVPLPYRASRVVQRAERELTPAERIRQKLGGHVQTDPTCAICLEAFGAHPVVRLNCGHEFHRDCIDESATGHLSTLEGIHGQGWRPPAWTAWFKCPICRRGHTLNQLFTCMQQAFTKKPPDKGGDGGSSGGLGGFGGGGRSTAISS